MGMESALCYPEESNARVLFAVWKSHFRTLPTLIFCSSPGKGGPLSNPSQVQMLVEGQLPAGRV